MKIINGEGQKWRERRDIVAIERERERVSGRTEDIEGRGGARGRGWKEAKRDEEAGDLHTYRHGG